MADEQQPQQTQQIELPEVVVTPKDDNSHMSLGLEAAAPGFLQRQQQKKNKQILPTDLSSSLRISGYAGLNDLHAPLWEPAPTGAPEPVQGNVSPELREKYADAIEDNKVHTPLDFTERHFGTMWGAMRGQVPPEEDTEQAQRETSAWMTNAAVGLAAKLPTNEALTDYAIGIAKDAGALGLSTNAYAEEDTHTVALVRKNLIDHWKETGEDPAAVYQRATWDLATRYDMLAEKRQQTPEQKAHDDTNLWSGETATQAQWEKGLTRVKKILNEKYGARDLSGELKGQKPEVHPDAIEPVSLIGEPADAKDALDFAKKLGLGVVELYAGGVAIGWALKLAGKTVGLIYNKVRTIDPAAKPGQALKWETPEKAHAVDEELHTAALEEAKHPTPEGAKSPEGEPLVTPEVKDMAQSYTAAAHLRDWIKDTFTGIVEDESGAMKLFRTTQQKWEDARRRSGMVAAKTVLNKETGLEKQTIKQFANALEPFRKEIEKHMPEFEAALAKGDAGATMDTMIGNLISYMQGRSYGVALRHDSPFAPLADTIRELNKEVEQKLRDYDAMGKINMKSFYEDYFVQNWKSRFEADKVFPVAKMGTTGWKQMRKYLTYEAGLQAGLEPKYPNPIEATLADMHGKLRYLAAIDARDNLIANGHAYWGFAARNEGDQQLTGFVAERNRIMNMRGTPGIGHNNPPEDMKMLQTERLYGTPGAARIWNNAFGMGMFSQPGSGELYDKFMHFANTTTLMKMIDPMFHMQTIGIGSWASGVGQTLEEVARGQFFRAIGSIMQLPIRPIVDAYIGGKASLIYKTRGLSDPYIQRLVENGLNFGRSNTFDMSAKPTLLQSYMRGSLIRELKEDAMKVFGNDLEATGQRIYLGLPRMGILLGKELGRIAQSFTSPIFGDIIPNMKIGAALQRQWSYIAANPSASEAAISSKVQQIVKDIENREGELNMDTIYARKAAKQTAGLLMISTSWAYGTYRGLLAAAGIDIERATGKLFKWNPTAFASLAGTIASLAAVNSLKQYFMDGRFPWQTPTPIKDMIVYRTGGKNIDGTPERAQTPNELKELVDLGGIIAHGMTDPWGVGPHITKYGLDKWVPGWKMMLEVANNQDAQGHIISQRPGGYKRYFLEQTEQIFESQMKDAKKGTGLGPFMTFMGDRPAAGWLQNWQADQMKKQMWHMKEHQKEMRRDLREDSQRITPRGYRTPPNQFTPPGYK